MPVDERLTANSGVDIVGVIPLDGDFTVAARLRVPMVANRGLRPAVS